MARSTKKDNQAETGESEFAGMPGMAGWLEIMTQSAQFMAGRLQHDMETQRAFLECRTPQDVMKLQTEFYRTAIEQYTAEASRMMQKMTEAATQSAKQATTLTSRSYDDIPL